MRLHCSRTRPHRSAGGKCRKVGIVKVYPASKARHAHWWRSLRAAGIPIEASWIDAPFNRANSEPPTSEQWSRHWRQCIDEASNADVCLFVDLPGENQCGALVEM